MSNNIYRVLAILSVPAILLLYSYSGGSPGGKTGSIGDGGSTCTDCHAGTATFNPGWITTNIPEEGFTPGETYTITATGTHSGVVKFGFELTTEDDAGNKVGTLAITDASRSKFANGNNAVTHTAAGNAPSGNTNTWSMDWTAPEDVEGAIWFYAAFNAANGNGNTGGDIIYTSSYSVTEFVPVPVVVSVNPDHGEQGWMGEVTIMGENTKWEGEGVTSVVFKFNSNPFEKFVGTNIQIVSDTELTCDISIPEDKTIGLYDVFVDVLKLDDGFTVDVISAIGENILISQVNAFPNPATDFINIVLPEGANFRMVDMMGHLIVANESSNQQERLDLSGLEKGIYFVQVFYKGKTTTKRILKY